MNHQIVKIEVDQKDDACLKITLRQLPSRIQFWRSDRAQLVSYKGYGRNWYRLPCFKPASNQTARLLKEISRGPQFKHLRYKLQN
jgi:hypothetical protein